MKNTISLILLSSLLTGCLAYAKVNKTSKVNQDLALVADMVTFVGVEGLAFNAESDRTFLLGYGVGAAIIATDLITSLIVDK